MRAVGPALLVVGIALAWFTGEWLAHVGGILIFLGVLAILAALAARRERQ